MKELRGFVQATRCFGREERHRAHMRAEDPHRNAKQKTCVYRKRRLYGSESGLGWTWVDSTAGWRVGRV